MKIILVDPNLVSTFFGNNFFDPNYGALLTLSMPVECSTSVGFQYNGLCQCFHFGVLIL